MRTILLLTSLLLSSSLYGQFQIELDLIADGFATPVDIANAGDHRLFIVEKPGVIRILDADRNLLQEPFLDISGRVNDNGGERGLLGLVFHPHYENNGYFFVNYTRADGSTQVSRFEVSGDDPDRADPDSETAIIEVAQPFANHNAGDLNFGPDDGFLYIALGDGGSGGDPGNRSQDPQELLGKILRLDIDNGDPYAIPDDNPFVDDPNVLDEIWAIGLRNPFRFSFDCHTGDMWIGDVGQDSFEEIDFQPAGSQGGENYGWRCYEGNAPFNTSGCPPVDSFTMPAFTYEHVGAGCSGSVTGGYVYRGEQFPDMQGAYIFADFCTGRIRALKADAEGAIEEVPDVFEGTLGNIITFGIDNDKELYLARANGQVYQVQDATTTSTENIATSPAPFRVINNPFHNQINLQFKRAARYQLTVLNARGQAVADAAPQQMTAGATLSVDARDWAAGVYVVQVRDLEGERIWTRKLVRAE